MNKDQLYEAVLARDPRFDGKFFSAVKTTGIYCRPICPAKPQKKNIEFFLSAIEAEKAGYRPCLRCRPESAPLSAAWFGKTSIVQRALKNIAVEGYFENDEEDFALKFGVSARHLRRLFNEEVGQTPKQIAFNNRLNFAKKLIFETNLPMTQIAFSSGFSSLRRFNDAFKKRFHKEPRSLRRENFEAGPTIKSDLAYTFTLSYRPPLDWDHLLNHFRSHLIAGVETITENSYERCFRIQGKIGFLKVTKDPQKDQLQVEIETEDPAILFLVTQKIRQMFDLDSDPVLISNAFEKNAFLNRLFQQHSGLRIATAWDPFEAAICTVLGQLVSLKQARSLVEQLVVNYGDKIIHPRSKETCYLFPRPEKLMKCDLLKLRTTEARRNTIRQLAYLVHTQELILDVPQDSDLICKQLKAIAGIGDWSAEYISLRALGNVDAFPKTDLILKRALQKHPEIDPNQFRPWRGYLAIHLWHRYAAELSKLKKFKQANVKKTTDKNSKTKVKSLKS